MSDQFEPKPSDNEASNIPDVPPPDQPPAPPYQPAPLQQQGQPQPGAYPPPGPYAQPPQGYYPPPGPYYPPKPPKDRSIAIILEVLPGLFGILGIGWFYSGNTGAGIGWLVGMLAWDGVALIVATLTVGFGLLCTLPISILLLVLSTISLNGYTKKHPELFGA